MYNKQPKPDYVIYDQHDMPLFVGKKIECMKYLNYKEISFHNLVHRTRVNPLKGGYKIFKIED